MYTLHTRALERAEVFGNKWAPQSRMIRVIRLNMKKFQILDKTIFSLNAKYGQAFKIKIFCLFYGGMKIVIF